MPISLTVTRPKLDTVNDFGLSLSPDTPSIDGNKILLPIKIDNVSPDPVTFSCTFTTGEDTLTFTNSTGKNINELIRLGDIVSGASSPYDLGAYVTNISVTGTTVTLTISDTASASDTAPLTFTAPDIDSTVYILELDHLASGSNIVIRPALYTYNGTKVKDADQDGEDEVTLSDATSKINLAVQSINVDLFLNNARVQRTNNL